MARPGGGEGDQQRDGHRPHAGRLGPLDRDERRLAALVAEGRSDVEIAAMLHLGPGDVETRLGSIFGKLRIGSRTELALLAGRRRGRRG